jgi:hypothetical protein
MNTGSYYCDQTEKHIHVRDQTRKQNFGTMVYNNYSTLILYRHNGS